MTTEDVWLRELEALPHFDASDGELLIVSPHPDDETLGAGALIASHGARALPVTVLAITDGEHAYGDTPGLAATRIREQEEAVAHLSRGRARIIRLHLPDSGVSRQEHQVSAALLKVVTPKTHIVAPWIGDFHPDHEACGRAAAAVARQTGARLSWYFFWTWHRGSPDLIRYLPLKAFPLSDDLRERKWNALLHHKSQLHHPSGEPILPENLLFPAQRNFEVFADA